MLWGSPRASWRRRRFPGAPPSRSPCGQHSGPSCGSEHRRPGWPCACHPLSSPDTRGPVEVCCARRRTHLLLLSWEVHGGRQPGGILPRAPVDVLEQAFPRGCVCLLVPPMPVLPSQALPGGWTGPGLAALFLAMAACAHALWRPSQVRHARELSWHLLCLTRSWSPRGRRKLLRLPPCLNRTDSASRYTSL